jgi:N6-adenosine-specific RNA methylase IME4
VRGCASGSRGEQEKGCFFTGLGFRTRADPEPCPLATKGRPERFASDAAKLVVSPRREHSRKPDEIHERIERLAPGPCLELFTRTVRPGWDAWGAEVGLFDRGEVPTRRWASKSDPNAAA